LFHTLLRDGEHNVKKREPEGNANAAKGAPKQSLCMPPPADCRNPRRMPRLAAYRLRLSGEIAMAKGQMRSNKEKKKEKADGKPKAVSAYKQQFGKQTSQPVTPPKKG
jgi:hypothetical protein